jgi:hypothetical protein
MKKITLLFLLTIVSLNMNAQLTEGFETDSPTGWTFMQTESDDPGFIQTTSRSNTGAASFYHDDDNIAAESTSWMISPSYTVSAGEVLSFFYNNNFNTYSVESGVWISNASGDPIVNTADFSEVYDIDANFSEDIWVSHEYDLSSYVGQTIYVAFKYRGDYADEVYIDDFSINAPSTPPSCSSTPGPIDGATDVLNGPITLTWDVPSSGPTPTSYALYAGISADALSLFANYTTNTTGTDLSVTEYSTTIYWKVVPVNGTAEATGCPVWSFTTQDPPPPPTNDVLTGAIPITPAYQDTGCNQAGFTLNFGNDGTTDSGLDGSCNATDTGLDQFFTWTATTSGLKFTDMAPGNPGIVIRDTAGNEITCSGTFGGEAILTGWEVGDDLILQIYDYGTSVSNVAFCLEEYTPPPPIVPTYSATFNTFPEDRWSEASGAYGSPSGTSGSFLGGDFAYDSNNSNGASAKVNIYGGSIDEYLISPKFNLSGATYYLNYDVALTGYNSTSAATLGADDYVALLVTQDGGSSWQELSRWDSTTAISNAGQSAVEITLSGYGDVVQFAYYAFSDTSNEDNDFYIDNFQIMTTTLGVTNNSIENFNLFPTLVKDIITFTSQKTIDSFEVYNLLGQQVFSEKINTKTAEFNLTPLAKGVYIVQVQSGNSIGSYKIIKE